MMLSFSVRRPGSGYKVTKCWLIGLSKNVLDWQCQAARVGDGSNVPGLCGSTNWELVTLGGDGVTILAEFFASSLAWFNLKPVVHTRLFIPLMYLFQWVMGLGAYRTAWKRQTRYFGHQHSQQYSSLVFDNRGIGLSDKPSCRYSTSEIAKDVVDLLISIDWLDKDYATSTTSKRDLHIIGVSMGGMISQELGLLIPDSIASLVLVSTFARIVRTVPFIQNLRDRINMFIPRDIDFQLMDISKRLFSHDFLALPDTEYDDPQLNFPTNWDRFAANEIVKRSDKEGFTRKGFMLQAIAAGWHFKTKEQLLLLKEKVGAERIAVLHGTIDRMITFRHFEILKEELGDGPEYRVWQGRGHVLMWEEEDEFNAFVRDWAEKWDAKP